ncbi:MAG TPA: 4Fe-4S dicluster domain-containing protein [Thermoflexia bacterium]|nr:4Fe-4S dicluster domain-containing protein [Thermoflexia bacterium]
MLWQNDHLSEEHYQQLLTRLNKFPQGAPPSELLYKILNNLLSDKEAGIMARLPVKPFTAEQASRYLKMDLAETRQVLAGLASRAVLVDVERDGESVYTLPPPMPGFFEFSLMRLREDVDQQVLSELYYQYCTVEDEFMGALMDGETQIGRIFVNESVLQPEIKVLDYERASEVIRTASHLGISTCYCRFKKDQVGEACDAPQDICMTFNASAESLTKHGFAREVDVAESLDLLQVAYEHNLIQFGENARTGLNFICNCCGCCCEALIAARRFEERRAFRSNFMPEVQADTCTGCGKCVEVCPMEAITLVSAHDAQHPHRKKARVQTDICIGCGVCARVCPTQSIAMQSRPERVLTPLDTTHRIVLMAIERGQLQNLIFDRQLLWSQRSLAALLGALLKLPPLKQAMATKQMRSRYLVALINRFY